MTKIVTIMMTMVMRVKMTLMTAKVRVFLIFCSVAIVDDSPGGEFFLVMKVMIMARTVMMLTMMMMMTMTKMMRMPMMTELFTWQEWL